ncbi:MAG: ZIP family metal transporter [Bacteroidetes bacterium]|nr:ZIP family metal transporter [Bacteroidota bacterium]
MIYPLYIILFFGALLSGLSVLWLKISSRNLKLILSFSGAYLFAISVLHLIPDIYSGGDGSIGIYILAGFFLQIFLEFFSEGIEHGHIHIHAGHGKTFPLTIMLSLSVHSFLEGMPLSQNADQISESNKQLLVGILLHNVPIAIALMTMLKESKVGKSMALFSLIAFAAMAPLGALVSRLIGTSVINIADYFNNIMAVVIGIFLHISTTILFESSENHRFNLLKFLIILLGAGLALFSL